MAHENEIEQYCRDHFNEICIVADMQIGRLIGFGEDNWDIYYIYKTLDGKVKWSTCVGPCESLKDVYPRYDIMENFFNLNQCKRSDEFQLITDFSENKEFPW